MTDPLHAHLAADHARLEALLDAADRGDGFDMASYAPFRRGLLRHIGMEERIVLPTIARRGGSPAPDAQRLRLDHGAIAALLVPSPTRAIVDTLRRILTCHNAIEEREGGIYHLWSQCTSGDVDTALRLLRDHPEVPVQPHNDSPLAHQAARRALLRAGWDPEA